jgi:molybdopterin-biosynthesis enzyme MoeA-like protein
MNFGAIIIGDEILSGKRVDRHFARIAELLGVRGLRLAWVEYLGDDRSRIAATLRRSLAAGDVVFSFGGIGNTPDDHTRQAAARRWASTWSCIRMPSVKSVPASATRSPTFACCSGPFRVA